ncbi:GFA family protein [Hoeflea halophila]|uniref:GFA family protein n=1 Tax=Hoeflea halophila TaxID=714899 RepID=UPI003CCE36F5
MVQPAYEAASFSLIKGSPKIYTHLSEGSGKAIHINFCDTCGTKLFPDIRTLRRSGRCLQGNTG